jgi:hypothetical protein
MQAITTVGLDIAKSVFQVHIDAAGKAIGAGVSMELGRKDQATALMSAAMIDARAALPGASSWTCMPGRNDRRRQLRRMMFAMSGEIAGTGLLSAVAAWGDYLAHERRFARTTVRSYGRTVAGFLAGMRYRFDRPLELVDLAELRRADFRAWMAGLADGAKVRQLAAVRSFSASSRAPASPPTLSCVRSADRASGTCCRGRCRRGSRGRDRNCGRFGAEPWIGPRDRALLTLLHGCGLRSSEALELDVGDCRGRHGHRSE